MLVSTFRSLTSSLLVVLTLCLFCGNLCEEPDSNCVISMQDEEVLSCAGAEAVRVCGGPYIAVGLGRKDTEEADAENQLPAMTLSAPELIESFEKHG